MKVLIADDSQLLRERLRLELEKLNNVEQILEAKNSLEAKNYIFEDNPDLVILDIRMPGGNGLDLLENVREEKKEIKFIILSNYSYTQFKKKSLESGADYFFSKSEEFEMLIDTVKNIQA